MKTVCFIAVFCVVSLAEIGSVRSEPLRQEAAAATHTVTMKSMSFDPKKLVVRVGDTVAWSNGALTTHTATSDDEGKTFDTGEVESEMTSKPVTFGRAGEFGYHCKIHGKAMRGTIVVKAADE